MKANRLELESLDILGLRQDATQDDIRKAYKRMAKKYHPDKNDAHGAIDMFQKVQAAYKVLSEDCQTQKRPGDRDPRHCSEEKYQPGCMLCELSKRRANAKFYQRRSWVWTLCTSIVWRSMSRNYQR